jgi:hypothetical protein
MSGWRAQVPWAVLLSAAFVIRTAFDWFEPTTDFHLGHGSTVPLPHRLPGCSAR